MISRAGVASIKSRKGTSDTRKQCDSVLLQDQREARRDSVEELIETTNVEERTIGEDIFSIATDKTQTSRVHPETILQIGSNSEQDTHGNAKEEIEELFLGITNRISDIKEKHRGLIDAKSKFMANWDVVMMILLIFTAWVTPFEVSFLDTRMNALFVINRFVDLAFVADMAVNFRLIFEDKEGTIILSKNLIARRYLRGWFTIDLLSILPFDIVGLTVNSTEVSQMKSMRLVRLLRLLKLLRVLRSSRIVSRWESQLGLSYASLACLKYAILLGTALHWIACLLFLMPSVVNDDVDLNWASLSYPQFELTNPGEMYSLSLYCAVSIFMSGSLPSEITLGSIAERVSVMFVILIGGTIYVWVIGSVSSILASMDQPTQLFKQSMDHLNSYCEEAKLPNELKLRLRAFMNQAKRLHRNKFYKQVTSMISPTLQGEVTAQTHAKWIVSLNFVAKCQDEDEKRHLVSSLCCGARDTVVEYNSIYFFVAQVIDIANKLSSLCCGARDTVIQRGEYCEFLYIVERGILASNGNIIGKSHCVGNDVVLQRYRWRRQYTVKSLTFVDLHSLRAKDLFLILERGDYSHTRKVVNSVAARMYIARIMIMASKEPQILDGLRTVTVRTASRNNGENADSCSCCNELPIMQEQMQEMNQQLSNVARQTEAIFQALQRFEGTQPPKSERQA
jgi:potassium voltage-gated channel Eag-related subfamily H protein 7